MRLLADMHISPRTVEFLRSLGHDVVRVNEILPATASDETIVARAADEGRAVLTQDLDLSANIALVCECLVAKGAAGLGKRCDRRDDHHGGRPAHSPPLAAYSIVCLEKTPDSLSVFFPRVPRRLVALLKCRFSAENLPPFICRKKAACDLLSLNGFPSCNRF